MDAVSIVTSMSPEIRKTYGREFLSSYRKHMQDVPLRVFTDGEMDVFDQAWDGLLWRDLTEDKEAEDFKKRFAGKEEPSNYRRQAVKFSRKVFAISNMMETTGWVLWFDADVVFTKKPPQAFWDIVCGDRDQHWPDQHWPSISYLGRPYFAHSETGFMAFNLREAAVLKMIYDMRSHYIGKNPMIFSLDEWHDSMVFDRCLGRSEIFNRSKNNIVPNSCKELHVWPHTALSAFSTHNKGPVRKQKAYGDKARRGA